METITINNTRYNVARRDDSLSAIGKDKSLKENQQLLWIVKPNGKHVYMTIETTQNCTASFGEVSEIF